MAFSIRSSASDFSSFPTTAFVGFIVVSVVAVAGAEGVGALANDVGGGLVVVAFVPAGVATCAETGAATAAEGGENT